jgi:hypothetical protein
MKCPDCPTVFVTETLESYTTHQGDLWSDGFVDRRYAEFDEGVPIFFCPRCRRWYWIDDGHILLEVPVDISPSAIPEIDSCPLLGQEDVSKALEQSWCVERERLLRFTLLWLQNHDRRRPDGDGSKLTHALMANLERLEEIVDPREDPLPAAEIRRELGDFASAAAVLDAAVESATCEPDSALIKKMRTYIAARSVEPFAVETSDTPAPSIPADLPDPEENADEVNKRLIDAGFYLFPRDQDVFAFPRLHRRSDADAAPLLSLRLDLVNPNWEGWAPIIGQNDHRAILRFGRLFRFEDRKIYEQSIPAWRDELEWFWDQWSYTVESGEDAETADRYFRILYQLSYGMYDAGSDYGLGLTAADAEAVIDEPFTPTVGGNSYYRHLWDHYWALHSGNPESWIPDLQRAEAEASRSRARAADGLDYIELGGSPRWFQGCDKTPIVDGRPCRFVAQIWLDYINAGTSLVYLFYDPPSGIVAQTYDYD